MKRNIQFVLLSVILALIYIIPAFLSPFDQVWYDSLNKPSFVPPQIVFPFVWTILFILTAISVALTLLTKTTESKRFYIILIILNYLFIQMYSYIMFDLKDITLAFVNVLLVFITSFMVYIVGSKINKKASLLIIPLILWSGFAAFMQLGILKYN